MRGGDVLNDGDVEMTSFDARSGRKLAHQRVDHNISIQDVDQEESSLIKIKRPKTSQGVRSGVKPKSLNQSTSIQ